MGMYSTLHIPKVLKVIIELIPGAINIPRKPIGAFFSSLDIFQC